MNTDSRAKILVIDDDVDIGNMIRMILGHRGFDVTFLEGPEKVKELISSNGIDLLILDMFLAGVNGTDTCADLKSDPATAAVPVIMMSTHPDAKNTCINAGADDFMSKPFDVQDLLVKINSCIAKKN